MSRDPHEKKWPPATTVRLRKRLHEAFERFLPPPLTTMEFVRYCRDLYGTRKGNRWDADYTWSVYVSHDPCHDDGRNRYDRNTVIALHRWNGQYRIIGRELPRNRALRLAKGLE
jgi:hypothetical protein